MVGVCDLLSLLLFLGDKEGKCALLTNKVDGSKVARFLCLICMWFSKDQRANIIKTEKIGLCLRMLITTLHSIVNTIGRTHVFI